MNSPTPALTPRLVPLSDGRPGLRSTLQIEIHEPPPHSEIRDNSCNSCQAPSGLSDNCCLDFVSSSECLDRYDEIISADGWRLENYRRNPVFQNAHQYGDIL